MERKKKRLGKNAVRALAWTAGAVAFGLPWAAFQVVPAATATTQATSPQVIVVPAGSKVVFTGSSAGATGVKVVRSKATATAQTSTVKISARHDDRRLGTTSVRGDDDAHRDPDTSSASRVPRHGHVRGSHHAR